MATKKAPAGYVPDLPPGCTLSFFREGDEAALLNLLNSAFDGAWPQRMISVPAIDHLRWKLHSNELAAQLHVVAEQSGRMIAARPIWVDPLKVDDRIVLSRLAIDRAVLPELQRHRVMTAMEARTPPEWFERFDVVFGTSNNWQSINFIPGTPHRRSIDVVARRLDAQLPTMIPVDWALRRVDAFDDRVDVLWGAASGAFRAMFVRTKKRLNYRYADKRAGDYTIIIAEQAERVLGYIIYASWQQTGRIADVFVLPDRADVLESLLAYALDQLQQEGNSSLECWRDTYHPYGPTLEKLGFDQPRRSQGATLHSLNGEDDELAFFADPKSAVHIMAGDTDLV